MTKFSLSRISRAFLLVCGAALSACTPPLLPDPEMKHNPVIADLRPWCIGRLVFDRPADSRVYSERYEFAGSTITFEADVSKQRFHRLMDERERELKSKRRVKIISYKEMIEKGLASMEVETNSPLLEAMATPSPLSRIFVHKRDAGRADALLKTEGYILVASNLLTLAGFAASNGGQDAIREDSAWYRETTPRDDWAVPLERGFCVKGALVGSQPISTESARQTIVLFPGRPATLILKMRSSLDIDQQTSLLKALPDLRRRLDGAGLFNKVRVLRSGKRTFAGMQAEEVLLAMKEDGVELFRFHLIAPGTEKDRARPYTEVELQLGGKPREGLPPEKATSPVDEGGALQAWDTLLDSFRLRPGAL